ncbi:MAG: 4'-phosphopantetheinyl transferase family protein [Chloroflexota bacterium]
MHGHQAHLWYIHPDLITSQAARSIYGQVLSSDEVARNRRFVFPQGRHEHLLTRALVRGVLSTYQPSIPPQSWRFSVNEFGRPEVAGPVCTPRLRFNVSHTSGLIVCLVTVERDVGIDVENTTRATIGGPRIADHYFSPNEAGALRSLPEAAQHDRFFDYWTLKEAYIKARGLGLQLPLGQFSFFSTTGECWSGYPEGESPIRISFGPEIHDNPERWQFELRHQTPLHRLAIAIGRTPGEPDLRVMTYSGLPPLRPKTVPPAF